MAAASEAQHDLELRHSSIGLADVLFQAITYMAPGVGLAFSIGIAVPISGATLPLSVVVALAACTFCAVAIGQLAKHIPSAGGLYTYAARGIGPKAGVLLTKLLAGRDADCSPFDDEVPRVDAQGAHWVEPFLVIDVDSHATAKNQRLRQPSYRGVRSDLSPKDLLT